MSSNVFQRGKVWYIRWDEEPGPDGKRSEKMRSCGKHAIRNDAEQALARVLAWTIREPIPQITLYYEGEPQPIIGNAGNLAKRFRNTDLTCPLKSDSITVREAEMAAGVQAVYIATPEGREILVWNEVLDHEQRSAVLGVDPIPLQYRHSAQNLIGRSHSPAAPRR